MSNVLFDKAIDHIPTILIDFKMDTSLLGEFASNLWIHRPTIKKLHIIVTNNVSFINLKLPIQYQ